MDISTNNLSDIFVNGSENAGALFCGTMAIVDYLHGGTTASWPFRLISQQGRRSNVIGRFA